MSFKKNKIKFREIIGVLLALLFVFPYKAFAADSKCMLQLASGMIIDLKSIAECFEDKYGYDKDTLRRNKKKAEAPQVTIMLDSTSPKEGELVTAAAVPTGFRTPYEELYYTWYIVHTDEDGRPLPETDTIAKAKREAMGIIARGNFNPELFGVDYDNIAPGEEDDDGFLAPAGGLKGTGGKCYQHFFGYRDKDPEKTGLDFSISCGEDRVSCGGAVVGTGQFGIDKERCWQLDPTNPDTDGDGVQDEADLVGLNQSSFTWTYRKGDRIGVSVEGVSNIGMEDNNSYYKIMSARPFSVAGEGVDGGFISGDGCGSDRRGLNCYRTIRVFEEKTQPMTITMSSSPSEPKIFTDPNTDNLSDWVTVDVVVEGEDVDSDFLYYDWTFNKCNSLNIDSCEDSEIDSNSLEFVSFSEGVGKKKVTFRPTKEFADSMDGEIYIRASVFIKKHRDDKTKHLESRVIKYNKNPLWVAFYQTKLEMIDGSYHWVPDRSRKICDQGVAKYYCPILNNQVIYAEVQFPVADGVWNNDGQFPDSPLGCSSTGGSAQNCWAFAWRVDGNPVDFYDEDNCKFSSESGVLKKNNTGCRGDEQRKGYFLFANNLIGGTSYVSVLAKRNNAGESSNLEVRRAIEIGDPGVFVRGVGSTEASQMDDAENVFVAKEGERVEFTAREIVDAATGEVLKPALIQYYLPVFWVYDADNDIIYNEKDPSMRLSWMLNNIRIDRSSVEQTFFDEMDIEYGQSDPSKAGNIAFNYNAGPRSSFALEAIVEKDYDDNYKLTAMDVWGAPEFSRLTGKTITTIRTEENLEAEMVSIGSFFASTVKNSPMYIVLSLKISLILVLIFSIAVKLGKPLRE